MKQFLSVLLVLVCSYNVSADSALHDDSVRYLNHTSESALDMKMKCQSKGLMTVDNTDPMCVRHVPVIQEQSFSQSFCTSQAVNLNRRHQDLCLKLITTQKVSKYAADLCSYFSGTDAFNCLESAAGKFFGTNNSIMCELFTSGRDALKCVEKVSGLKISDQVMESCLQTNDHVSCVLQKLGQ